jgi:hypothetical protein
VSAGTYDPRNAYFLGGLLRYVQHRGNCDWLQPMWHKGPCDCGLTELIKQLPEDIRKPLVEASEHARATVEELNTRKAVEPVWPGDLESPHGSDE